MGKFGEEVVASGESEIPLMRNYSHALEPRSDELFTAVIRAVDEENLGTDSLQRSLGSSETCLEMASILVADHEYAYFEVHGSLSIWLRRDRT